MFDAVIGRGAARDDFAGVPLEALLYLELEVTVEASGGQGAGGDGGAHGATGLGPVEAVAETAGSGEGGDVGEGGFDAVFDAPELEPLTERILRFLSAHFLK